MGGEHAVLNVHSGVKSEFIDLAQDDSLVSSLLRVLRKEDRPSGIEGRINIIMSAVDIQGVFGESAGTDLKHHGRAFPRRVVILFHRVGQSLPRGKVHHPAPGDSESGGATLGRMFPLGFNRDFLVAPDIELPFGVGGLVNFPTLGRGGDGIEHSTFCNAHLHMLGNQLIAVTGNGNPRVFRASSVIACSRSCDGLRILWFVGHWRVNSIGLLVTVRNQEDCIEKKTDNLAVCPV